MRVILKYSEDNSIIELPGYYLITILNCDQWINPYRKICVSFSNRRHTWTHTHSSKVRKKNVLINFSVIYIKKIIKYFHYFLTLIHIRTRIYNYL